MELSDVNFSCKTYLYLEDDDDDFEDSVEEKPKKSENEEASRPKESKVDEDDEVLVEVIFIFCIISSTFEILLYFGCSCIG